MGVKGKVLTLSGALGAFPARLNSAVLYGDGVGEGSAKVYDISAQASAAASNLKLQLETSSITGDSSMLHIGNGLDGMEFRNSIFVVLANANSFSGVFERSG